ncbi:phage tail tube protein [Candidatus Magnetaquicoccus inordinatus]|uniref:phage tail tube protein n=1 Tax=Candidatus Magnetaquicoccus inordinatus TaxID=2496818 RepID=UPI00102C4860|nr:phage tail tube protein [Candidatus Magnetaquicoccus inordinatus]
MPSNAISAQGSTLSIGTASGSANNITAVSLTNPCRVTLQSSVSGLSVGDVVAIADITGTTQLNGRTFVVEYIESANKIITLAGVDALAYTAWSSGGTVTPTTLTEITEVQSFSGFDGASSEIDVTNLSSTAKEFVAGLADSGNVSVEMNGYLDDPGQIALAAAQTSGALKKFKLELPDGHTATFSAFVKSFSASGGVDQTFKRSASLRLSGPVTWA